MIRRLQPAMLAVAVLASLSGCSSQQSDFCDALADRFDLSALQRALDAGDDAAVTRELRQLQEIRDLAPPAIRDDATSVIDTAINTVRAITGVTGPNGQVAPVDTATLNEALAGVSDSAQRLADYATRTCHLKLQR
jgi:hypothetical protein